MFTWHYFIRTQRLPVKYVFGKAPLDVPELAIALKAQFTSGQVAVFYDVQYHHLAHQLEKMLKNEFPERAALAKLDLDTQCKPEANSMQDQAQSISFCGRSILATGSKHLDNWNIVFLGDDSRTLTSAFFLHPYFRLNLSLNSQSFRYYNDVQSSTSILLSSLLRSCQAVFELQQSSDAALLSHRESKRC